LSNQEPIEEGTNDMLKKQLVENVLVKPIFMKINDVSINLITNVSFLEKVCTKGHIVFQVLPPLTLWLQYKELAHLVMYLFIFSFSNL
jgi:hypothetical protein